MPYLGMKNYDLHYRRAMYRRSRSRLRRCVSSGLHLRRNGPATAVFAEEDVPEEWTSYTRKNFAYFEGNEEREVARGRGA